MAGSRTRIREFGSSQPVVLIERRGFRCSQRRGRFKLCGGTLCSPLEIVIWLTLQSRSKGPAGTQKFNTIVSADAFHQLKAPQAGWRAKSLVILVEPSLTGDCRKIMTALSGTAAILNNRSAAALAAEAIAAQLGGEHENYGWGRHRLESERRDTGYGTQRIRPKLVRHARDQCAARATGRWRADRLRHALLLDHQQSDGRLAVVLADRDHEHRDGDGDHHRRHRPLGGLGDGPGFAGDRDGVRRRHSMALSIAGGLAVGFCSACATAS